ncbi:MAG: RNA-directed DNA polymerase [Proteobacteria bacterium]|nr:MAG: RNA-directed DNA polymerase [Pseudomonadota bacterium]
MPLPAVRPVTGTPPSHSTLPALERARPAQPQTLQPPPTPQLQRAPTPPPQASEPQEAGVEQSQHRRLAVRDERLAQKLVTTQHAVTARRPSKRSFHRDEAARMFSSTLRTQRRGIRDLVTDEQQLVRYGLPIWRTEAELALALQVGLKALRHYTVHRAQDRVLHYVTFAIPKRSGGERLITAPKTRLKALQRRLNALLVSKLPVSEYAHGFRTGHSVLTNAKPHVGKQVVLRLDIHEFFPSIHFGRVRGLFLALGYGYPVATALAVLMTEAPRQPVQIGEVCLYPPCGPRTCPQGAPTSPGLSNALLVRLDRRLAGLAKQRGFSYTRYADDLTFSGDDIAAAHALRLAAARVVREEGFELNVKKTRVARRASRQLVTGVIVNRVLGLSRQTRRRLRAAVHQYLQAHAAGAADPRTLARLDGRIAYLSMLNSEQARRLTMD